MDKGVRNTALERGTQGELGWVGAHVASRKESLNLFSDIVSLS